jgi:hypothetical protein
MKGDGIMEDLYALMLNMEELEWLDDFIGLHSTMNPNDADIETSVTSKIAIILKDNDKSE